MQIVHQNVQGQADTAAFRHPKFFAGGIADIGGSWESGVCAPAGFRIEPIGLVRWPEGKPRQNLKAFSYPSSKFLVPWKYGI